MARSSGAKNASAVGGVELQPQPHVIQPAVRGAIAAGLGSAGEPTITPCPAISSHNSAPGSFGQSKRKKNSPPPSQKRRNSPHPSSAEAPPCISAAEYVADDHTPTGPSSIYQTTPPIFNQRNTPEGGGSFRPLTNRSAIQPSLPSSPRLVANFPCAPVPPTPACGFAGKIAPAGSRRPKRQLGGAGQHNANQQLIQAPITLSNTNYSQSNGQQDGSLRGQFDNATGDYHQPSSHINKTSPSAKTTAVAIDIQAAPLHLHPSPTSTCISQKINPADNSKHQEVSSSSPSSAFLVQPMHSVDLALLQMLKAGAPPHASVPPLPHAFSSPPVLPPSARQIPPSSNKSPPLPRNRTPPLPSSSKPISTPPSHTSDSAISSSSFAAGRFKTSPRPEDVPMPTFTFPGDSTITKTRETAIDMFITEAYSKTFRSRASAQ